MVPQKYTHCVDCGEEKKTYSQQLSPRCNSCAGIKKRADKGEYYTHCIDCGVEKPQGTSRRSPRCRECGYKHLTNRPFFDVCRECGVTKKHNKSPLCWSCASKKQWEERPGDRTITYSACSECGAEKADTTSELCHSCSTRLTWDTIRERTRTLYDTCQECGQPKPMTDRELCLSCAGVQRMKELFGTEGKEYPIGWCHTLKERIRDRDRRRCQLCGKTAVENGRKLDVHHIDEDKHNLDPSNLITLCASCHGKTKWDHSFYYQVFTKYRGRQPKQDWQHLIIVV